MTITRRTVLQLFGASALAACGDNLAAADVPEIQGYAWPPSVTGELRIFVSTISPWFCVELHRVGASELVTRQGPFAGASVARGDSELAWAWPEYRIPLALPGGVYVAVLRRCDARGETTDIDPQLASANGEMKIVFVVRSSGAPILYKLPLFTYHAYNQTGGGSLYGVWDTVQVALQRPGGGSGHTRTGTETGELFADGMVDPLGAPFDRQWNTFERWDGKLVRWLAARGNSVDFCTDWDLHIEPGLLAPYRLLVSAGHDEYWSDAMRDAVDDFIGGGGNVAFFGGNTSFWRVEIDVDSAILHCDKIDNQDGHWSNTRFENALTGLCEFAGGTNAQPRDPQGYTVVAPDLWPLEGVTSTVIGEAASLIGYEVDGAPIDAAGNLTFERDTPPNLQVLARCALPQGNPSPDGWYITPGQGVAMMVLFNRTGTVFNAGTIDWPRVLADGDPDVGRITANVIDRLSARTLSRIASEPFVGTPIQHPDAIASAACAEGTVIAVADGNLYLIGATRDVLPYFGANRRSTVRALHARRHGVCVEELDGTLHELSWGAAVARR